MVLLRPCIAITDYATRRQTRKSKSWAGHGSTLTQSVSQASNPAVMPNRGSIIADFYFTVDLNCKQYKSTMGLIKEFPYSLDA